MITKELEPLAEEARKSRNVMEFEIRLTNQPNIISLATNRPIGGYYGKQKDEFRVSYTALVLN